MWNHRRLSWIIISLCCVFIHITIASPIYVPQFLPSSTGRNIRHLPCVSRRTGETGICMFAFTCAKANGTHLGTCIDRFYFGSCCKIDEEPDVGPQDNSIDDGPPATSRPFVTTHNPIESNDIPPYFPRPKPNDQSKPSGTYTTVATTITQATQSTKSTSHTHGGSTKIVTKKPTIQTIETTTQSIRLSTFQTVQNGSYEKFTTTSAPSKNFTKISTESTKYSSNTSTTSTTSKLSVGTTQKPTVPFKITTLSTTSRPIVGTSKPITKKPLHTTILHTTTQTSIQRPIQTTTSKSIITTTQKTVPSTRFPPRNTTSVKPVTQQFTKRPPTVSTKRPLVTSTKRPTLSTKKPTLPTKKPTTQSNSSIGSSHGTTTVASTYLTSNKTKPTFTTTESNLLSSTEETLVTLVTETVSFVTRKPITITTEKPIYHKITTKPKPTTSRPVVTTIISTKPTKISTLTTDKLETSTTQKTTFQTTTSNSTSEITKFKPTESSIETTIKPIRITTPTTVSVASFISSTSSTASSQTSKVPIVNQTLEEVPQTTPSSGLVTWSSHSDETPTKATDVLSTTKRHDEITESEWTPITTPDGWVMIQSPPTTVETSSENLGSSTIKLESLSSTVSSDVPVRSTTEVPTTTEQVTETSTILTTLSSIATIAVDTETPISIETLNMSDYKQVCGRRIFPESRIVGGNRSTFGKWPWQISLRQWKTSTYLHKCGAALLNENWAITAAHCVENVSPADLLLRIGEYDLANEEEPYGFQERRVQIIASHPQFDPRTFEYDLALLRFYEPLPTFQPNVLPICLPDDDETYVGRTAFVTGWGRLYDEGPLPSILQEVAVPVINNTVCEAMYRNAGYIEHIPHIFICAGWRNGGFDSCEGDSGGPMVIQRARDKRWLLAGIISWGIGCAVPNQPGVYTRISEFREWINQILQF
ncbi:serine proteinase stubble isoform X1 [Vespa velutina]|uniref:serine proteinase stubble isoform X1 n=2 Tax=Vespa velutina TaxID=202808 RepID=UPI001FB4DAB4|nr:serine proteinase stubble isoform X1 [Vespa velutina]XP_047362143.1 serine proteinase stubble isoform X1 [Vespa velutina]XP_047362144.1 serine proteinase stubble isoform X1 [Vespa velutina]XP_047362145.1 serine proteinase stubble isoform X1 [Vespa velutina]